MADASGETMLKRRTHGRVEVLSVRAPELYRADAIEQLGHELRRLIETASPASFVLDLGAVHFLSSAALGLLLNIRAHLEERKYPFALAAASGEVAEVLRRARLDEVMPVYPTVEEALRRLAKR
jgi:anti-anti-sigma factor